jgi:hypothetical protein
MCIVGKHLQYLGAFATQLQKATINFEMSACPFVRIEQLEFQSADLHEK